MTMTGLESFDKTVQKSDMWLREIMENMGWDNREQAYRALRGVLHALRDRLTIDEAANLSAQLPMLIRGIFFESWKPSVVPIKYRTKKDFLDRIAAESNDPTLNVEKSTQVVLTILRRHVTAGEIDEIIAMLPKEIQELWQRR